MQKTAKQGNNALAEALFYYTKLQGYSQVEQFISTQRRKYLTAEERASLLPTGGGGKEIDKMSEVSEMSNWEKERIEEIAKACEVSFAETERLWREEQDEMDAILYDCLMHGVG